ncbi:hypothetical protein KC872_00035 [Candidatus Kaiserbacteria bacterium]|nr:hypothetical protein [Candidatus Kaiserbacteria bacterium]
MFASLLLAYSGKIKSHFTLASFYGMYVTFCAVLILILGVTDIVWIVVLIFITLNAIQWGLSGVDEGFQLGIIKSSKFKATLLSVSSQVKLLFQGISSFGLGLAIEKFSYQYGFLLLGIVFLLVLGPLYLYILKRSKEGAYGNV